MQDKKRGCEVWICNLDLYLFCEDFFLTLRSDPVLPPTYLDGEIGTRSISPCLQALCRLRMTSVRSQPACSRVIDAKRAADRRAAHILIAYDTSAQIMAEFAVSENKRADHLFILFLFYAAQNSTFHRLNAPLSPAEYTPFILHQLRMRDRICRRWMMSLAVALNCSKAQPFVSWSPLIAPQELRRPNVVSSMILAKIIHYQT